MELFNGVDFLLQLALVLNQIELPIVLLYFLYLLGLSELVDLVFHAGDEAGQLLDLHVVPQYEQFLLLVMVLLEVVDDVLKHDLLLGQLHLLHVVDVHDLVVESHHLVLELVVGSLELEGH